MWFNKYPATDFHEMNLDWIIGEIKKLHTDWDDFKVINTIHFEGPWDITKQYQAWTLVDDLNTNNGYISKKPVPAGVSIDNTDYWVLVANYSSIIADLQNRVVLLESDVSSLETDVSNLQTTTNALIDHDKQDMLHKDANVIIIGDSWGLLESSESQAGWLAYIEDYVKVKNLYTACYSGSGFARPGVRTFLYQLQNDISITVPADEINEIIVQGFVNDVANGVSQNDIIDAMKDFADYCETTYPNAIIKVVNLSRFNCWCPENFTMKHAGEAVNGYKGILFYLDYQDYTVQDWFVNYYHLSSYGYEQCAKYLACAIKGIEPTLSMTNITKTVYTYDGGNIDIYRVVNGKITTMVITGGDSQWYITTNGAHDYSLGKSWTYTLLSGQAIKIGGYNAPFDSFQRIPFTGIACNAARTDFKYPLTGYLEIDGGSIKMQTFSSSSDGATTRIILNPIRIDMPNSYI